MSESIHNLLDVDTIQSIADQVWTALVGEEEFLIPIPEPLPADVVSAWVDVFGPWNGTIVVTCGASTAQDFARALLGEDCPPDIEPEDLEDAFGELANVLGGNVKAVLPGPSTLGLPVYNTVAPVGDPEQTVVLEAVWRGQPLVITVQGAAAVASPAEHEEVSL